MPTPHWPTLVIVISLAVWAPGTSAAQEAPTPQPDDRGSRLAHAGVGLVVGAIAGGIIGRIAAGDGCRVEGCDDGDLVVTIKTVIGTATGAVIGAVVGAVLPAGPRRLAESATRPLRVAGIDVRPGLRVSFDDRRER